MNRPVPVGDLLEATRAPSSLAPKEIAQRQPKPPAQAGGLINPNVKSGFFVDHREDGGPLLLVPDDELKVIDGIAREMKKEEAKRSTIIPAQEGIAFHFNERGDLLLTQSRWPDEDSVIHVAEENLDSFIDKLTDAMGIPSFGG